MVAIMRKELLQLRRDPRMIVMIIVMPLLLLLLFGVALKLELQSARLAYFIEQPSVFTNLIKTGLWSDGYFQPYEVPSKSALIDAIQSGEALAGLHIDGMFNQQLVENAQPHVTLYIDGSMPSLATAMKYHSAGASDDSVTNDMFFSDADSDQVVVAQKPFIMDIEVLFNPHEKETWFFLPGVIGVLIMQIALILTGISVVREREKGTLEQLLVTPLNRTRFIIGKLAPYILIALVDFYFILGAGWVLFDLPQPYSHGVLFLLALLYVSVMIALGLLISLLATTQQQAMFLAIFIIIPSVLLSGFIFPLDAIPAYVRPVSYLIPFTYFVEIIRGLLIKQTLIIDLLNAYVALAGFLVFFVLFAIMRFRKTL